MAGQRGITDAHVADFGEGRLQRREQLAFQLAVDGVAGILPVDVAAHIGVEQHGIGNFVAVLAVAADGDIHIEADVVVDDAERHGVERTVLVADNLLGVKVIDALVVRGLTAAEEALAELREESIEAFAERAAQKTRLRRSVIYKLARSCTELRNLALIHNHHALSVGNRDHRAGRDDVFAAVLIGGAFVHALFPFCNQHIRGQSLAVKIILPCIPKGTVHGSESRFQKSHFISSSLLPRLCCAGPRRPRKPNAPSITERASRDHSQNATLNVLICFPGRFLPIFCSSTTIVLY